MIAALKNLAQMLYLENVVSHDREKKRKGNE